MAARPVGVGEVRPWRHRGCTFRLRPGGSGGEGRRMARHGTVGLKGSLAAIVVGFGLVSGACGDGGSGGNPGVGGTNGNPGGGSTTGALHPPWNELATPVI